MASSFRNSEKITLEFGAIFLRGYVTMVFHPRAVGADREVLESAKAREGSSGRIFPSVPTGQPGLSGNVLARRLFPNLSYFFVYHPGLRIPSMATEIRQLNKFFGQD
jgi:hypothetical protein